MLNECNFGFLVNLWENISVNICRTSGTWNLKWSIKYSIILYQTPHSQTYIFNAPVIYTTHLQLYCIHATLNTRSHSVHLRAHTHKHHPCHSNTPQSTSHAILHSTTHPTSTSTISKRPHYTNHTPHYITHHPTFTITTNHTHSSSHCTPNIKVAMHSYRFNPEWEQGILKFKDVSFFHCFMATEYWSK